MKGRRPHGMLDIVSARQWIERNAAAFGGDPDLVTIFGQSGGRARTRRIRSTPLARGLFCGEILEAGIRAGPATVKASQL